MIVRWYFSFFLVFAIVPGFLVHSLSAAGGSPEQIMESAAAAIEENKLDPSIKMLEGISMEGLSDESLGRLHFLLGKAKYIKVIEDIRACRSDGSQTGSELKDDQVAPLKEALEHFQTSYELSPNSDWIPQALYATGLIQGYGCLQRFQDAAKTYKLLAEKYPDTNLGKAAARKYDILKSRLEGKGHGHGQP